MKKQFNDLKREQKQWRGHILHEIASLDSRLKAQKETTEPEISHNFESNDQVLKFLVDHFDYNELKELKAETTKATEELKTLMDMKKPGKWYPLARTMKPTRGRRTRRSRWRPLT